MRSSRSSGSTIRRSSSPTSSMLRTPDNFLVTLVKSSAPGDVDLVRVVFQPELAERRFAEVPFRVQGAHLFEVAVEPGRACNEQKAGPNRTGMPKVVDDAWRDVDERSGPELHELLVPNQEPEVPFDHVEEFFVLAMHMCAGAACGTRLEGDFNEIVVAGRSHAPCLEHDTGSWDRKRNPFSFLRPEHTTL